MTTVADLKVAPYNPRKISKAQLDVLGRSMREFGDLSGIVHNTRTGNVVGGHMRIRHLDPEWPIVGGFVLGPNGERWSYRAVDWPEEKEKAANLAANKMGGDFDMTGVEAMLKELKNLNFDLDLTGFLEDERARMFPDLSPALEGEDDVPATPSMPITNPGDIIELGNHRLVCGDCTNPDDVERLSNGNHFDMVLTDPPYGVGYVGKTKDALTIENDQKDEEALGILVAGAFNLAQLRSRPGAYWYATVPAGPLHLIFASDWKNRGILRQIMVWAKDSMVLGHSEYHYQHEPILFGWVEGPRHKNADRTRTSLWACKRPSRSEQHPTMKPVELWEKAMRDGSVAGEIVYDPFMGSGTTIIAAEKLGRKAYGLEISPNYCDVVVTRWEKLTGKQAIRQTEGNSATI